MSFLCSNIFHDLVFDLTFSRALMPDAFFTSSEILPESAAVSNVRADFMCGRGGEK